MEAKALAMFQRYGPRKVNQVCGQIRGKSLKYAQDILPTVPRTAGVLVTKTLNSAAANLKTRLGKSLEPENVVVKSAWVGQGPMKHMKRVLPAPMGRAMQIKRKVCHLTIVVADKG
jgi:large subunit ribosomal protein L22